ncbi:MAG: FecR domain-containing protein [Verrucomicrobiota bacterium]
MSNDSHSSAAKAASRKAAEWSVLLNDDPEDAALLAEFEKWVNSDPLHRDSWERIQSTYTKIGGLEATTTGSWPERETLELAENLETSFEVSRWWKRGAGIGLAASIAFFFLLDIWVLNADFSTSTAEQSELTLEDGSLIALAPESALDVDFSESVRRVHLLRGDAYFEISRDEKRPFQVEAGGKRVTVLGTAFEVTHSGSSVVVSVFHGEVRVEDKEAESPRSENLLIGDRYSMSEDKPAVRSKVVPEDIASWRENMLVAQELPISEVVDALRGYHSGSILVSDSLSSQRVTGLFKLDEPIETLRGIALSHDATVKQLSPWIVIMSD